MPKPKDQICNTCIYWSPEQGVTKLHGDGASSGSCLRYPPIIVSPLTLDSAWPIVRNNDWCGEWKG